MISLKYLSHAHLHVDVFKNVLIAPISEFRSVVWAFGLFFEQHNDEVVFMTCRYDVYSI